ncbi:hypothetical protein ACLK1S_02515 [Escherichia coli]
MDTACDDSLRCVFSCSTSVHCSSLCLSTRGIGCTAGIPFVLTFQRMGITFAASVLKLVVLTASLSAINSDVFGVGPVLHGMAERAAREKFQQNVASRYPWVTVLVMTTRAAVCGVSGAGHAQNVFLVMASLATFATVWVWIMILLSQIAFRRRLPREEVEALKFKVPGGVATTMAV